MEKRENTIICIVGLVLGTTYFVLFWLTAEERRFRFVPPTQQQSYPSVEWRR